MTSRSDIVVLLIACCLIALRAGDPLDVARQLIAVDRHLAGRQRNPCETAGDDPLLTPADDRSLARSLGGETARSHASGARKRQDARVRERVRLRVR
jgi:hypothetical protein